MGGGAGAGSVLDGDGSKGGGHQPGCGGSQVGDGPVRGGSTLGGDVVVVGEGLSVGTGDKPLEGHVGTGCVVGKREGPVHGQESRCGVVQEAVGEGPVVESLSGVSATQRGVVEGTAVHDIILDTGCSHTMIHQDLVPAEKRVSGEAVTLQCAHGDVVLYPLADINVQVSGIAFTGRAAILHTLPVSMLVGVDVLVLGHLLKMKGTPRVCIHPKEASHMLCAVHPAKRGGPSARPMQMDGVIWTSNCTYFSTVNHTSDSQEKLLHNSASTLSILGHAIQLTNAPTDFQWLMQQVVTSLNPSTGPDFVSVYLDNILIFSWTLEEHISHLGQ